MEYLPHQYISQELVFIDHMSYKIIIREIVSYLNFSYMSLPDCDIHDNNNYNKLLFHKHTYRYVSLVLCTPSNGSQVYHQIPLQI